jgi:imidazolonepropionase-like amidohydrolase
VHVADGRIVSVGGPPRPADQVIDARGGTVLPGLIDAHCHAYGISLDMMATESQPLSYVALAAARRLGRALARGFTTVRDPAGGDAGLARAIAENLIPSPRYLWTGAALSQTGVTATRAVPTARPARAMRTAVRSSTESTRCAGRSGSASAAARTRSRS